MTGTAHSLEAVVHGLPPAVDDPPLIEGGACTQQHSRNGTSQFPYAAWVPHHGTDGTDGIAEQRLQQRLKQLHITAGTAPESITRGEWQQCYPTPG